METKNRTTTGENFARNLKRILTERDMMQKDLADRLNVATATVTFWMQGSVPKADKLDRLCEVLGVTPADLLVDEAVMTKPKRTHHREVPLYGSISAGTGFFSESNILRYIAIDDSVKGDFAVIVKGDSMTGAGIEDGDIAIFAKQFLFHEGNIYAVWQMGENLSYLKRVYLNSNRYLLLSENSEYAPIIIENNEARLLGELTGIYRKVEQ